MTRIGPAGHCRDCRFRREIGEASHCVRRAPTPDPITAQARWPRVEPADYCGDFCATAQKRRSSLVKRQSRAVTRAP